jgi:hypothetical protein
MPPPSTVNVFGILHLVLAGLGVLFGLWGLVSRMFFSAFQGMTPGDPMMVAQRKYMEDLWPVTVMNSIFFLGLAALLLTAGLKLVRTRPDGVMWSNRYAWTSIITKAISLVVTVSYVLPLSNRMTGEIFSHTPGMPAGSANMAASWMKSLSAVMTVLIPVLSCIYPALVLFFLSRPAVKAWVARGR